MNFIHTVESLLNEAGFFLRSQFRWRQKKYIEQNEPRLGLFSNRKNEQYLLLREKKLLEEYDLSGIQNRSSKTRYIETLTYLDYLTQLLPVNSLQQNGELRWLDVGAKNWAYVESIYRLLEKCHSDFILTGIELDANRLYRDFYRRRDYAHSYIEHLPKAKYIAGNVFTHKKKYDVVSCFLPFVFPEPCLKWGLPLRFFSPTEFLSHLVSLLNENGVLLIINQDEDEFIAQGKLFESIQERDGDIVQVEWKGKLSDSFMEYIYPRYGWRGRKR
ncbi:MAG: hypothetical protein KGZ58_12590 [Ignavibacteriales bacterium]|nr:hypothetical protein [Ignavibacteriales bacterium]